METTSSSILRTFNPLDSIFEVFIGVWFFNVCKDVLERTTSTTSPEGGNFINYFVLGSVVYVCIMVVTLDKCSILLSGLTSGDIHRYVSDSLEAIGWIGFIASVPVVMRFSFYPDLGNAAYWWIGPLSLVASVVTAAIRIGLTSRDK